jgi:hypothetical protein
MRLTIVPSDKLVLVDSMAISFDLDAASIPQNVHALQWTNTFGHIEYTDKASVEISELPEWANVCVALWIEQDAIIAPPITLSDLDLQILAREERNNLLKDTDWWATTDRTMTAEQTSYRQALRDITNQAGFPNDITWPKVPS